MTEKPHWWDDVEQAEKHFREQHPDDDRSLTEIAQSGDWQLWFDGGCVPLLAV